MELTLVVALAIVLAVATWAAPRADARRIPAEHHGRAREDGPPITLIDHRPRRSSRVLPVLAVAATVVATITAVIVNRLG